MKTKAFVSSYCQRLFALGAMIPVAIGAAPAVSPGQVFQFQDADGGGTECRVATSHLPDTVNCPALTMFNTSQSFVRVNYDQVVAGTGLGLGNYSTAWVYNDFTIPGNPTNLVDVQISVTFDYFGMLFAAGAYKTSANLDLSVRDITAANGTGMVTSSTIFQQERSGDQGFTDLSSGEELQYPRGENASISVKVRRGRSYRITFKLEALAEAFVAGQVSTRSSASWSKLLVAVDADHVEQLSLHDTAVQSALAQHDADIKSVLAAHDASVKAAITQHDASIKETLAQHDATTKAALAQHDADIKKKLDSLQGQLGDINAKLDEIRDLLLTPQGRRPGFPKK